METMDFTTKPLALIDVIHSREFCTYEDATILQEPQNTHRAWSLKLTRVLVEAKD